MTPQEQYPKFYSHPYMFVGQLIVRDTKSIWYEIDTKFDGYLCAKCFDYMDIQDFEPLFKPQQGEQFIKDLEDAVRLGSECKDMNYVREHELFYEFEDNGKSLTVLKDYLAQVLYCIPYEGGEYFDTAAYVDRMRELGYYI